MACSARRKKLEFTLFHRGGERDAKNRPRRGGPQKPRKHGEFGSNSELDRVREGGEKGRVREGRGRAELEKREGSVVKAVAWNRNISYIGEIGSRYESLAALYTPLRHCHCVCTSYFVAGLHGDKRKKERKRKGKDEWNN